MKNNKYYSFIYIVGIFMFVSGIVAGLIGRNLCINNNENYETILPEIETIEEISTVLHNPDSGFIYVCYNDGSYVNVYNQNGEFLWAVSVPYLRNSYFELKDDNLAVYNSTDAYLYNSSTGVFVSKSSSDSIDLSFYYKENKYVSKEDFKTGEIYFSTYNVFKVLNDGSYFYIVHKPAWYYIFHFPLDWLFSFIGAILLGIMLATKITLDYKKQKRDKEFNTNPRQQKMISYIKKTIVINILYSLINIITGLFGQAILCLGIFFVVIHFIISMIVISNIKDRSSFNSHEQTAFNFWMVYSIASILCAFLSVLIVALLAS